MIMVLRVAYGLQLTPGTGRLEQRPFMVQTRMLS